MITKLKNLIWKTDGMNFIDAPTNSKGLFQLVYGDHLIGTLKYEDGTWTFQYSDDFKKNPDLNPIINFPDKQKVYNSPELWPFFATRIPALNQPYQFKKIAKANANKEDSVALLKIFGSETITNPYRLVSN